jgi:hypothetical protein
MAMSPRRNILLLLAGITLAVVAYLCFTHEPEA